MQFKKIDFKEYNKIRKLLLVGSEAVKEEVYRDSKSIATIGIGINIGGDNLQGLWLKLILYYLFGLTKDIKEIPFIPFDSYQYTFKNIIKDTTSYKYQEYKTLIDNLSNEILQTLQTEIKTSTLNALIENQIKDYMDKTKEKKRQNPNSTLEQLQRLSEEDLKITKDSKGNNQTLEFKLTKQQAEELFNLMVINYEAMTLKHFLDKEISCFNKLKEKKESDKEYYKEFIPFVSATYQAPNIIRNNTLIQKAFNTYKSRFFIWAILRYTLGNDKIARRRILQSAVFNFNHQLENETENNQEKWQTCIDIFKGLNLLKENVENHKQTYLEYFKEQEKKMQSMQGGKLINVVTAIAKEYDIKDSPYATNPHHSSNYEIYRLGYINPNELQPLLNLLNPYVEYLDTLIPSAKFENNANFKRFKLTSLDESYQEIQSHQEYRFKPQNIYVIDKNNYNEVYNAISHYQSNNATENILLLITEHINEELKIQRPKNTYLYLLHTQPNTQEGNRIHNTIDCSLLNNPLKECISYNDKAELYLYEEQENNQPKIISLATQELVLKQEDNEELSAKEKDFTYNFDILKTLNIKKEEAILLTLSNYHFFLKETNHSNMNSNPISNVNSINNNPNPNLLNGNSPINKGSNHFTYTLQTILQPNQSYSTLGIKLNSPKELDTFSNNGNFRIQLNNIHLNSIQTQTNLTITKDSPIFIYVQDSKQNYITKLQDNTLTCKINLKRNTTKDEYNNLELQDTQLVFLSFIPFKDNTQANNTYAQKLQITSEDLVRGYIEKDFKIPCSHLKESEMFRRWRGERAALYQLEKTEGRIYAIDFLNNDIDDELLAKIDEEEKENKTRILKSFKKINDTIQTQDTRIISLSTIDIINRKDMSKNPLIYKALDKLILDYQKYKDNFLQDYYVEFGKYMVESGINEKKTKTYGDILTTLNKCCRLITKSKIFGNVEYNNGGVAIFHLYENYVLKFEGDENGLDKVSHFLFSALISFQEGIKAANKFSITKKSLIF